MVKITNEFVKMISKQDERLIHLLRRNARVSVTELARELNLSRSTVQNRINRLEATGVIRGYSVELGGEFSRQQVAAHVSIKVHQKLTVKTNIELEQISQVAQLFAVSGEYDLIAIVQAPSLEELSAVLDDIGNLDGVERTNSSVVLETKFRR
ncbi:AsnC family transcriptional regulator [Marinobacterium nitratireducens]|uniref:AsnC family transcriptional regulator n=2 Tax=Marinobacterium nitratireducens TaxID=518897 RepID=A0A917ZCD2_9GAMM|nr:AsnC family transcriptional regulator [Marinobacterium nitratireducens]